MKISAVLVTSQLAVVGAVQAAEDAATTAAPAASADAAGSDAAAAVAPVIDACPDDKAALTALYDSLGGEGWKKGGPTDNDINLRWVSGADHCGWFGIECDLAGKVISVDLNANKLTGTIPAELGDLGCLTTLNLDDNSIGGTIPATITKLVSLERLLLDANKIQGDIPSTLADMTKLTSIDIDYNALHVAKDAGAGVATSLEQKHGSNFVETQTLDAKNVKVTDRSQDGTTLTLKWDQAGPAPEGGYRVYMSTSFDGPFAQIKNLSGTGVDTAAGEVKGKANTEATVGGLKPGTKYYFIIHTFTSAHVDNRNEVESDGLTGVPAVGITDSDDSDLDGILNVDEKRIGTDPNNPDSDRDGIHDRVEADPLNPKNTDKDALINALDPDDDNDNVPTRQEVIIPEDSSLTAKFKDTDGDGTPDHLDDDDDGDGVPTKVETTDSKGNVDLTKDTDKDGTPDYLDTDDDNDGKLTIDEGTGDEDGDGIPDYLDPTNDKKAVLGDTAEKVETSIGGGSAGLGLALAGALGLIRRRRRLAATAAAVVPLLMISGLAGAADQAVDEAKKIAQQELKKVEGKAKPAEESVAPAARNLKDERIDFAVKQSEPQRGGRIYLGLGAGLSTLEPDILDGLNLRVDDDTDAGYKFLFGYEATDHVSIEASYGALGKSTLSPGAKEVDYKVGSLYGVYNMFDYREGFNPIVKLGISSIENSTSDNVEFTKKNDATLSAGLGLEYEFGNGFVVRGEYEYLSKDAQFASINIIKRMGGEPPIVIPAPAPVVAAPAPAPAPAVNVGPTNVQVEFKIPDSDNDGVNDIRDACPNTPEGAKVDEFGCAKFEGVLKGVNFEYNSSRLTSRARMILDEVADELKNYPNVKIQVQAHTDSKGSSGYNLWLSKARAQSVIDYLATRGVSTRRLIPIGFGETQPIASNKTDAGRALNRRVEFKVISSQ
ncbi:MAG TPA: hypothetical protein ENJ35_10290 [Gammaproteobacteria bacterium]|nr:hypothetical protein [Gammaproteobacteria bacterium]